jgi:hypothetical protein
VVRATSCSAAPTVNNWVQTVGVICAVYRELKGTYNRGDTALRRAAVADGPDKGTQGPKGRPGGGL